MTNPLFWEVDQVLSGPNRTLVILEIELDNENAKAPLFPKWLVNYVREEVTNTVTSSSMASE